MRTRLLLDCNYLAHRAYYTFGKLRQGDASTGVVFGFLKDLIDLQDRFRPECFIFCFDYGTPFREHIYPGYKAKRKEKYENPADKAFKVERDRQIRELRKQHLPALGYQNIFYEKGWEADDIIAAIVQQYEKNKKIRHIIVSNDHDMYQLLGRTVSIYKPTKHQIYTEDIFSREFGISPTQFIDCKAIAGCCSDNIEGIDGVGEITAAKFISGKLGVDTAAHNKIVMGNSVWKRNIKLVKLPWPGLPKFEINYPEELNKGSWRHLAAKLEMHSIENKEPGKKGGFGV